MKSALLLTGDISYFEEYILNYEKICDIINPDIFLFISNQDNLNITAIKKKLMISNIFFSNIKKIFYTDLDNENEYFIYNYMTMIDHSKEWLGFDIFKQFKEKLTGIEFISNYQNHNNINYDFVLTSNFNTLIDINTFPTTIKDNQIYGFINENNNDIFLTNQLNNLYKLFNGIITLFLKNHIDPLVNRSINTMIDYTIKQNNLTLHKIINSQTIEPKLFNTSITLVTCFYDIQRKMSLHFFRTNDEYFENCVNVLNKKNPIVIFTTQDFVNRLINIRKQTDTYLLYTETIILPFEELKYYNMYETIENIQKENTNIIDINIKNGTWFYQSKYIILICNKVCFLKKVAKLNPFNSKIFQWVDFGIHKNSYNHNPDYFSDMYFNNIFYKKDKIKLVGFLNRLNIFDIIKYYNNSCANVVCSGLFGGDYNSIIKLEKLFDDEFINMLNNKLVNNDKFILYYLLCKHFDFFDYNILNNWNELCQTYSKNNINICICISGDTRSFNNCKQNIKENIINVFDNYNLKSYLFFSTWLDSEYYPTSYDGLFTTIEIEKKNHDFFIQNYSSDQYLKYYQHCLSTTCSNAVSMWYKINRSFQLAQNFANNNNITFDIIIRIRPDVIYNSPIDINIIKNAILNDYLYMPYNSGINFVHPVTKFMADHYFLGNYNIMYNIMNIFNNIKLNDISSNIYNIHTGEGFLWGCVKKNNIKIKRFDIKYYIYRLNYIQSVIV